MLENTCEQTYILTKNFLGDVQVENLSDGSCNEGENADDDYKRSRIALAYLYLQVWVFHFTLYNAKWNHLYLVKRHFKHVFRFADSNQKLCKKILVN